MSQDKRRRARGLLERLEFATGDMQSLPFEDGSFDAVLSTYSLCPLYDPARGARELFRVVKAGGLVGVAHSTNPKNPIVRKIAGAVEAVAWRFPGLSLGCRSVHVLEALRESGASVEFEATIGMPLWPFKVFIVRKPE